jgi:hypothetical protein
MPTHYLAKEGQGKPWEDDILVACMTLNINLELAETAFVHGRENGFDGPFALAFDALIAHAHMNSDMALSFGLKALEKLDPTKARGFAWQMASIASAIGRIHTADELINKHTLLEYFPNWNEWTKTANTKLKQLGSITSPSTLLEKRSFLELREDIYLKTPSLLREIQAIRSGTQAIFDLHVPPGSGGVYFLDVGPCVKNAALSMTLNFEPRKDKNKKNEFVKIILSDLHVQNKTTVGQGLYIHSDGTIIIESNSAESASLYMGRCDKIAHGEPTNVRLTCIDSVLEVAVDEKRVYIGPLCPFAHELTSIKWSMFLQSARLSVRDVSWKSINHYVEGAEPENCLKTFRKLSAENKWGEAITSLETLAETSDWNVNRLISEILIEQNKFSEARQYARKYAETSTNARAWLAWAYASLAVDLLSAEEVIKTLMTNVRKNSQWSNSSYLYPFAMLLKKSGHVNDCINFLKPLARPDDGITAVCLFFCYLELNDIENARKHTARLFMDRSLSPPSELIIRFIDAAVAIRAGLPPPSLHEIRKIIGKKTIDKHTPFCLALWGKELTEKNIEAAIGQIKSAGLWRFYNGLMAFAQKNDQLAHSEFTFIVANFKPSREGQLAMELISILDAEKNKQPPENAPVITWPYSKDSYPPLKLPKPSTEDLPQPAPETGANNIF